MKKEYKIQVRFNQEDHDNLEEEAKTLGMTTSEFLRDLFHSRELGSPLHDEAAKAFVSGLCRIQSMYPDDEEINKEVKKLCRYLSL